MLLWLNTKKGVSCINLEEVQHIETLVEDGECYIDVRFKSGTCMAIEQTDAILSRMQEVIKEYNETFFPDIFSGIHTAQRTPCKPE